MRKKVPKTPLPGKRPNSSGREKPITLRFEISAKEHARLAALAKEAGMSLPELASLIFQAKTEKYEKLMKDIEETVTQTFFQEYNRLTEELTRINEPNERLKRLLLELFPSLKDELQEREPN